MCRSLITLVFAAVFAVAWTPAAHADYEDEIAVDFYDPGDAFDDPIEEEPAAEDDWIAVVLPPPMPEEDPAGEDEDLGVPDMDNDWERLEACRAAAEDLERLHWEIQQGEEQLEALRQRYYEVRALVEQITPYLDDDGNLRDGVDESAMDDDLWNLVEQHWNDTQRWTDLLNELYDTPLMMEEKSDELMGLYEDADFTRNSMQFYDCSEFGIQ